MNYIKEFESNYDFQFWSGAVDTTKILKERGDFDTVCEMLQELYEEDKYPTETEINDFFWFDTEIIAEWLGYESWEEYINNDKKDRPF